MVRIELDEKIAFELDKDNINAKADPSQVDVKFGKEISGKIGMATIQTTPDAADKIFNLAAGEWIRAANQRLQRRAGSRHGWNYKPLTNSWELEANETSRGYEIIVNNTHPASDYWDHGTEEHVIEADQADALKIPWPNAPPGVETTDDGSVFRQRAEVGGLPAIRFMEKGKRASKSLLRNNIDFDGELELVNL